MLPALALHNRQRLWRSQVVQRRRSGGYFSGSITRGVPELGMIVKPSRFWVDDEQNGIQIQSQTPFLCTLSLRVSLFLSTFDSFAHCSWASRLVLLQVFGNDTGETLA